MKKNIIKVKRYQKPLICLVGILIFILGIAVNRFMNAHADEIAYEYESNNIDYDNSTSNLSATNVKDAIDELYGKVSQCPNGKLCVELSNNYNTNILKAYVYDENTCVTGDETSCVETICYLAKNRNLCLSGTIIDYKVNDTETVRFHVLHDDGSTLTMQAQRSQVKGVAWHAGANNTSYGPDTILSQLESKTSSWSNVNDIQYNGVNTEFVGVNDLLNTQENMKNNNNYCTSYNSCGSNAYTYPTRTAKVRMITLQEAVNTGCTTDNRQCPKFMYNFLKHAKQYGAIQEDNLGGNDAYWTMNVVSSADVWVISKTGSLINVYNATSVTYNGARAVVVIDK